METTFALHSHRTLLPDGLSDATVVIENGKIKSIHHGELITDRFRVLPLKGNVLMPGLIDPHVHINEPGRTDWEGFDTATRAAAAGGITTLVDMPLNSSPVTTTVANLRKKLDAARGKLHVNCGFWGGIVPGNTLDLLGLEEAGILGFKAFLTHSGIDDFPNVTYADLRAAYSFLWDHGLPVLAHCELASLHAGEQQLKDHPRSHAAWLASRPPEWETEAVRMMIKLCQEFQVPTHIVHLVNSELIPEIREARSRGWPLTVETCPHYLYFAAEEIPEGATLFKCAPPIREKKFQDGLWQGLAEGDIDFIASDHSPAPPALKRVEDGNFAEAWGGIAGLQYALPVSWTAAQERGHSLLDLTRWMSAAPAKFIGLEGHKGKIQPGFDADLTVWDPEATFTVKESSTFHRHKASPYVGRQLSGVVKSTWVGGKKVYNGENRFNELGAGQVILRS